LTPGKAAPLASIPGPWRSSSIRISGAKYATCGPKTASGRPLAELAPETSSALDIDLGSRPSSGRPRPPGSDGVPGSAGAPGTDWAPGSDGAPGSGRLPPGSRPPVAGGAVDEREISRALNEPGSGGCSAPFARCLGFVW
jgi:hypothetical protein